MYDFRDNLTFNLTYPGKSASMTSSVIYADGSSSYMNSDGSVTTESAGYEGIRSFAIATTEITNDIMQSWVNQYSNYSAEGNMKAAYGTFLTALTTIWLSDSFANEVNSNLNVTWARCTATAVMCGVNNGGNYLSCLDPSMGMIAVGNMDNVKSFNFICSLMLSEEEEMAIGATGAPTVSTLSEIVSEVLNGATLEAILNPDNNTFTLMINGSEEYKIIIDLKTGIVQDILNDQGVQLKGAETTCAAYCYHNQLTNNVVNADAGLISAAEGLAGGAAFGAGVLLAIAGGPPEWAGLLLAAGILTCLEAEGVPEDPRNPRKWFKAGVDLVIAGIPGGLAAKELITISKTPWILMKSGLISSGGNYVLAATVGGSFAEGIEKVTNDCLTNYSLNNIEDSVMDYMHVPTHI